MIEGRRNAGPGAASYAFNVVPDVASSTPLTLGSTVNSSIGVAGESDDYTFTLAGALRHLRLTHWLTAQLPVESDRLRRRGPGLQPKLPKLGFI